MELLPGLGLVTRERGWGAQRETAEVANWWPQHRNRAEGVCDSLFVFVLPNLKKNVTKAPTLRNRRFYVKNPDFWLKTENLLILKPSQITRVSLRGGEGTALPGGHRALS